MSRMWLLRRVRWSGKAGEKKDDDRARSGGLLCQVVRKIVEICQEESAGGLAHDSLLVDLPPSCECLRIPVPVDCGLASSVIFRDLLCGSVNGHARLALVSER